MADTNSGGRKPRVTDDDLLSVFGDTDDPVLSTAEVADRLPIKRRGTLDRLRRLEDAGDVASKPIGGRNTVWWRVDAEAQNVGAGEDIADDGASPPARSTAAPPVDGDADADDSGLLDGVDFPGRGERERTARAAAIRRAYDLVRDRGEIESREIQETIWKEFQDDPIGYGASTSDRGPGWTLWDSCVRGALKELPGIVPPPERKSTWRYEE
jgi:hypothetical protein